MGQIFYGWIPSEKTSFWPFQVAVVVALKVTMKMKGKELFCGEKVCDVSEMNVEGRLVVEVCHGNKW